jgi:hypothetical protein
MPPEMWWKETCEELGLTHHPNHVSLKFLKTSPVRVGRHEYVIYLAFTLPHPIDILGECITRQAHTRHVSILFTSSSVSDLYRAATGAKVSSLEISISAVTSVRIVGSKK